MKKPILALLPLLLALSAPAWGAYTKSATITVPAAQVSTADQANFTVCGYVTDTSLTAGAAVIKHTANVNNQTVPLDFILTTDTSGLVLMNWEIVGYDSTAGKVWYCALVTTLSHSNPNVFYAFWGNTATTTFQGGLVGSAWDTYTQAVFHLYGLSLYDSSAHANNGGTLSATPPVADTTGPYGGGAAFTAASSEYISIPNSSSLNQTGNITVSAWIYYTATQSDYQVGKQADGGNNGYGLATGSGGGSGWFYPYINNVDTGQGGIISAWGQFAETVNGTSMYSYTNGSYQNSAYTGNGPFSNTNPLILGSNQSLANFYNGKLAEVRIASTYRSAGWLATEYNDGHAPATFATVTGIGNCTGTCGGGATPTVTMTPIIM